jgi:hypothetical protein
LVLKRWPLGSVDILDLEPGGIIPHWATNARPGTTIGPGLNGATIAA